MRKYTYIKLFYIVMQTNQRMLVMLLIHYSLCGICEKNFSAIMKGIYTVLPGQYFNI